MTLGDFIADFITAIILAGVPRSTEDWKSGDLAICVEVKASLGDGVDPKEGDLLRVKHVCGGGLFLHFEGKPDNRHWVAAYFRKVQPDTNAADDAQWVEQLRHLRRKIDA
jgi:hypothetical protein